MPANARTLDLEQAHADRLADLQTRTVALVADRYRTINPDNLDASFRRFIPAAAGIIGMAQRQAQAATDGFVRQLVRLEIGRPYEQAPGDDTIPGTTIDGRALESALASVPPAVFVTIKQGRPVSLALARGLHVVARMAATETADAGRRQTDHHLLTAPDLFAGWQWVARGTCAACLAMMNNATQGPGPLNGHPGCTCIKSPELANIQHKAHRATGREKYDALSPEEQVAVFASQGQQKAKALAQGRISLNDLVDRQGSHLWRDMITESPLPKVGRKATDELADAARGLIAQSKAADKEVTGYLQGLADDVGGRMAGLSFRIKQQGSLQRKIVTDLDNLAAAGTPRTAAEVADTVNDVLRYTMEVPAQDYWPAYRAVLDDLAAKGYTQVKAPKDFWVDSPDGYTGIHYLGRAPDGTRFELQFHTPESLAAKEPSHLKYELQRADTTTLAEKEALQVEIDNLWKPIRANPPPR